MNNTRGIVSINQPSNFDLIINFADTARKNFETIRKVRPIQIELTKKAWLEYIENSKFKNVVPNKGYIEALGLK